MGQIYSRAVIDSILNLDRLWTFSVLFCISLDLFNNNVSHIHYSMQIYINII